MLNQVKEVLVDLQRKNIYIKSIYIWGSASTTEYINGKSDIDTIAIVYESAPILEESRLNKEIKEVIPNLKVRFIYQSELDGNPSKGNLSRFIKPELVIYDFPAWAYICGYKFTKADFMLGKVPIDRILKVAAQQIEERFLPKPSEKDYVYFAKAVAKYIYFINQKRMPFKPFLYNDLIKDSIGKELEISKIISELKASNWDIQLMRDNIPLMVSELSSVSTHFVS